VTWPDLLRWTRLRSIAAASLATAASERVGLALVSGLRDVVRPVVIAMHKLRTRGSSLTTDLPLPLVEGRP
jgi:hypothetical protein